MSIKILSLAWECDIEDRSDLLVFLALADFANDEGECWPSMRRVAEKARVTERGAQKIVRRLEAGGWLTIEAGGGRGGCNFYRLNPEPQTPNTVHPNTVHRTGEQKPRTRVQKTPNGGSPEPSGTVKEPSDKDARDARGHLLSVMRAETADAFIDHRKAKRAKLTPRAAELIAKKLAQHPDPDAVVELSIMNGWTGVFPENPQQKRNQSHDRSNATDIARRAGERWAARGMDSGPGADPSQPLFQPRVIPGGSGGGD